MARDQQQQERPARELVPVERLTPSRLPITQAMMTKLDVTEASWRVLTDQLYPGARTVEAIHLALSYCRSRNLDIMTKPVHIVPMYSTVLKRMVETVWPSIGLLRITATRTGLWMGTDKKPEFGPEIEREFIDNYEDERDPRNNREVKRTVKYPEWCTFTVYKYVMGQRCPFSATVRWEEAYATVSRTSDMPNEMWRKRAEGQLEKCAEAAALRRAFPEELGMSYASDEMEGKTLETAKSMLIEGEVVSTASTASQNPAGEKIQATQGGVRGAASTTGQSTVGAAPNPSNQVEEINMGAGDGTEGHFDFEAFQQKILLANSLDEVNAVCEGREFDIYNRFIDEPTNMQIALKIKQARMRALRAGAPAVEGVPA